MLVLGTAGMVGIVLLLIAALAAGQVSTSILAAIGFLYMVWNTYDTFVIHQCWTLYLKVVES